jgi:hypothetical protein
MNDLQVQRPDILARHDARTLAFLFDSDRTTEVAHVLCTWDGVHFKAREREQAHWMALSPVVYGDVLSLISDHGERIASPVVLAKALSEETAERGAAVWDQVVRIERGRWSDAAMIREAARFKEDYLRRVQGGPQADDIRREWAKWKAEHIVQPAADGRVQTDDDARPQSRE